MANAKQLPSGSWRVQVFAGIGEDGKRKYKSFTANKKSEAELLAKHYQVESRLFKKPEKEKMLFKDALQEYIDNRTNTRSSQTIIKYNSMRDGFEMLNNIPVCDIDNSLLMRFVNELSEKRAYKTVSDYKNLAISVIREKIPAAVFRVNIGKAPEQDDAEACCNMPTEVQLKVILDKAPTPEVKVSIMLGAFCMMREGEVAALEKSDIEGNIITIRKSMKRGLDKKWYVAETKTKNIHKVIAPQFVVDAFIKLPGESIGLHPRQIANRYKKLVASLGYNDLSFHGLRKFGASQWSLENINTAYIQAAGGWSTDSIMKRVYVKTFSDAQEKAFETMNKKYQNIVNG